MGDTPKGDKPKVEEPKAVEPEAEASGADEPKADESRNGANGEGTTRRTDGTSNGINGGAETKTVVNGDSKAVNRPLTKEEEGLAKAYKELYDAQNAIPPNPLTTRKKQDALQEALEANSKANLENNKNIASDLSKKSKKEKVLWINGMITDVTKQIELLEKGLEAFYKASTSAPAITEVVKKDVKDPGQAEGGELVSTQYAEAGGQFADPSQYAL